MRLFLYNMSTIANCHAALRFSSFWPDVTAEETFFSPKRVPYALLALVLPSTFTHVRPKAFLSSKFLQSPFKLSEDTGVGLYLHSKEESVAVSHTLEEEFSALYQLFTVVRTRGDRTVLHITIDILLIYYLKQISKLHCFNM